jgi:predicted pyridoxine 5'-phosphate oxidase superfamily flavin-nucleotide-binding protein
MAVEVSQEVREVFNDKSTLKVLATSDENGVPHAVAKGSIHIDDDGNVVYWELLEKTISGRNATHSLWFDRKVSVLAIAKDGRSYQIKGIPYRTLISGREYEKCYIEAEKLNPENDLTAVYYIQPTEIREETYSVRLQQQRERHPLYQHLDKIAKGEDDET